MKLVVGALLATVSVFAHCVRAHVNYDMNTTLVERGFLAYSNLEKNCNLMEEACAPLNDIWGIYLAEKNFAIVGASNGVELVDTTIETNPRRGNHSFVHGCNSIWRDMKTWDNKLYVVEDSTALCACETQPCAPALTLITSQSSTPVSFTATYPSSSHATLMSNVSLSGSLLQADPADACDALSNPAVNNAIYLIDWYANEHKCEIDTILENVAKNGGIGVILGEVYAELFPSAPPVGSDDAQYKLPAVQVGQAVARKLKSNIKTQATVNNPAPTVTFDDTLLHDDNHYGTPGGITIIDIIEGELHLVKKERKFFDYAHNVLIERNRPYLYACGMHSMNGVSVNNGGVMVFSIADPHNPVLLGSWDTDYIHDLEIQYVDDEPRVMIGTGIYTKTVYEFDIDDPTTFGKNSSTFQWNTPDWPHNTATALNMEVIFISHEDKHMPITVWDIVDLEDPKYLGNISIHIENDTIPHNAYINNDLLWVSYYSEGVAVYDIREPANPILKGLYDTSPNYYNGYHGVWGVFPYSNHSSGHQQLAYGSDIERGLFVIELTEDDVETPAPTATGVVDPNSGGLTSAGKAVLVLVLLAVFALIFTFVVIAVVRMRRRNRTIDYMG